MKRKLLSMALAIALSLSCALIPKANVFAANEASSEQNTDKVWTTRKNVNGIEYTFTLDYRKSTVEVSEEKLKTFEDFFYEVYPKMYDRFGGYDESPVDVTITLDTEYILSFPSLENAVACALRDKVTVHNDFFEPDIPRYDYLSHELGHVLQYYYDREYYEFDNAVDLFAEYCSFVYAYKDGMYNDMIWPLEDIDQQNSRETSTRFLVWLDKELLSDDRDIIRDYFELCFEQRYQKNQWGDAWKQLFKGTKFEGMSIDQVWDKYKNSDFAKLSAMAPDTNTKSELISKTDVRNYIKKNGYSISYEAKLKGTKSENPSSNNMGASSTNEIKRSVSYEFGKNIVDGRYVFNTHILDSGNMNGKKEAFYNMCDALINGEDSFNCPNKETFDLITSSEILSCYFPFADGKIKGAGFENGVGKIEYLIPKDEFIAKEIEYEKQIEDVLNSKVTTDQKAFMKAIALFNYCRKTYTDDMEFNKIYTYLLLQCGVPAHLDMSKDNKLVTVVNISGSDYTYDPDSQEFKLFSK